jgi:hypothetical protein
MKEAAGEANLTVIAIVLIGVVAAIVTPLVNTFLQTAARKSCCTNYGGVWRNNECQQVSTSGTKVSYTKIPDTNYWDETNKACTLK